ncbi:ComEC/Rec2 family competence protein [Candidatus Woesebacteria bacterium]|nr:ComEC/Rec2 family competence protein [Candidatus Woesebacteria bacterium]
MKRVVLMFLFILILLIILQELYVRTNKGMESMPENLNGDMAVARTSTQHNESRWLCNETPVVWASGFSTYSDELLPQKEQIDSWYISNHGALIDKVFFISKGLILSTKNAFCYFIVSIDVWKGVFSEFRVSLLEVIESSIKLMYHSSISDVITGLTLGIDRASKGGNSHLFKVTGTQHLMAISGFNLSFFVVFVNRLYGKYFSKSKVLLLNLLIACFFIWIIGMSSGLIRAFLMFVGSHLAYLLNRQSRVLHIFFITLIVVIIFDISSIFTIGFQLSYAATLGIILFSKVNSKIENITQSVLVGSPGVNKNFLEYLFVGLGVSFAAQLLVLPLLLFYFQEFSLVGAVATVAVSWSMPLILQFGVVLAIAQFFVPLKILFVFSIPLFVISKSVLFLLNLFYYDFFLFHYSGFSIWHLFGYYIVFLLIYGIILVFKMNEKRKNHDKVYHFIF